MAKQISSERKTVFYIGMALMVLGGIMFASVFVTFAMQFGDFDNFESNAKSSMYRAIGGMALLIVGTVLCGVGSLGLAGSGLMLDPEKARQELEPYSRMTGGMIKDVLEEADLNLGGRPEQVVMIKCQSCGMLNEEDSKFCQECGTEI